MKKLRAQSTYIYVQSTTVYVPSSELGLPQPLSHKRVCPPPRTKGWGGTLACGMGVWDFQFRRLEKKRSTLTTLWIRVLNNIFQEFTAGWTGEVEVWINVCLFNCRSFSHQNWTLEGGLLGIYTQYTFLGTYFIKLKPPPPSPLKSVCTYTVQYSKW